MREYKPADNYAHLLIQFRTMVNLLRNADKMVEFYMKQYSEQSQQHLEALQASLDSEKEMNAILTEELERVTNENSRTKKPL